MKSITASRLSALDVSIHSQILDLLLFPGSAER